MNGEKFLNKLYRDLNLSEEVKHTSSGAKNKDEAVHRYMDRLETTHNQAIDKKRVDLLKTLYHKKYVVKEKDIPHYRDKQRIINAQKESLDKWLNYLLDENARYPIWAKYWAFQGMLKIGTYNETTGTYQKRSKNTLAPFIEVNPEVLAKCISMIVDYVETAKITDDTLNKLIESGNFQKLYTTLQKERKNNLINSNDNNDGIWIVYHHETEEEALYKEQNGIEPEYLKLYNSLQNYNTEWCTAGSKEMAKDQICGIRNYEGGDFYVYYTLDNKNQYKVPRIAIRMDGNNEIGEIRGVADGQNLEEGLEEIVENKLQTFNQLSTADINEYLEMIKNSKHITLLQKKNLKKEPFSIEDIKFIYEIDKEIASFGYETDPRVRELISSRNSLEDMLRLNNIQDRQALFENYEDEVLYEINEEMLYNRELMLELTKISTTFLEETDAPSHIINDKEIILNSLKYHCPELKHINDEDLNDRETVLKAVKQNSRIFQHITEELKKDKEIVLEVLEQQELHILDLSQSLQNDKEIILTVVKQNGRFLQYVNSNFKDDEEIVLTAVKQNGMSLEYASERLKNSKDIVTAAVKQKPFALKYANKNLKHNKNFLLKLIKDNVKVFSNIEHSLITDLEFVLLAIKANSAVIEHIDPLIRDNRIFMLKAVEKNVKVLKYVPELRKDDSFILNAIKINPFALAYGSKKIRSNKEHVLYAITKDIRVLKYVPIELLENEDFMLDAVKINGYSLTYTSDKIKNTKKIVLEAVKQNGLSLNYASDELKNDKDIALAAVKQNESALKYIGENIKNDNIFQLIALKEEIKELKHQEESIDNIDKKSQK